MMKKGTTVVQCLLSIVVQVHFNFQLYG